MIEFIYIAGIFVNINSISTLKDIKLRWEGDKCQISLLETTQIGGFTSSERLLIDGTCLEFINTHPETIKRSGGV